MSSTMKSINLMLLGTGLLLFCGCGAQAEKKGESTATGGTKENVVIETIMARRSVRKYKPQPVEREKLEKIVQCGINAPSAMNNQPWEVRVVTSQDYINGITEAYKKANPKVAEDSGFKNMFHNAPAVIFIASPKNGSGQLDCGLLGENMILAAQSLGLGTCCLGGPIGFIKSNSDARPYLSKLGFSDDYELLLAISVGYPDESPEAKPRDTSKAIFLEK